jgi:hypothetical protein
VKVVEIHWDDAWVDSGETSIKSATKNKPIQTVTIGFLIAENDNGVTVVADIYPKSPKKGKINNFIPWNVVTEYYEYE